MNHASWSSEEQGVIIHRYHFDLFIKKKMIFFRDYQNAPDKIKLSPVTF